MEELYLGETPTPKISADEVLVKIEATALNRADLLQRRGLYPPPPGESEILGLEMAGTVAETGSQVRDWKPGDRVFALLAGGGYAEYAKVHHGMLMPIPANLDFAEAACIAEAFLTAWQAVVWLAKLKKGESILIHAGASGVGTAATQIAKSRGANVTVTASAGKHGFCKKMGADRCIDYRSQDFGEVLANHADVLIDFIGGPYFTKNMKALKTDGRMVILGFLGGTKADRTDIAPILRKRLKIMGSTLRSRTLEYKTALTKDFQKHCLPLFENGKIRPVADAVFDWKDVQKAHLYMEANKNKGKIAMTV